MLSLRAPIDQSKVAPATQNSRPPKQSLQLRLALGFHRGHL